MSSEEAFRAYPTRPGTGLGGKRQRAIERGRRQPGRKGRGEWPRAVMRSASALITSAILLVNLGETAGHYVSSPLRMAR